MKNMLQGKTAWSFLFFLAVSLLGCQVGPPKGVTAFIVDEPTEFASAMLMFPKSEEYRLPLKLKYVDTNTFQTTATLPPGRYTLVVRTEMGRYMKIPVDIEAGKRLYHVNTGPTIADEDLIVQKPTNLLRGKVQVPSGEQPREVLVLFVEHDAILKRVAVSSDGRFEVAAPHEGTFWIEMFAFTDKKRWKWEGGPYDLRKSVDLDLVYLRSLNQ
ncbi:MAG: hypothetical protein N2Z21_06775 [Candidatus Sumerlaeaceae bacterium]|nr:hypothetical protein [Candidatus Sumerlaeaceae bacterium]